MSRAADRVALRLLLWSLAVGAVVWGLSYVIGSVAALVEAMLTMMVAVQ